MRITRVEPTDLFTGTAARPLQVVKVTVAGTGADRRPAEAAVSVRITGPAVRTPRPAEVAAPGPGEERCAEVGVEFAAPVTEGASRPVTVLAEQQAAGPAGPRGQAVATARLDTRITAAVPGWTMWMVSHFHYDPVWWGTQGQYTESRLLLPGEDGKLPEVRTAFELVGLHLDMAERDGDYKFVLAEVDYLKPYLDTHPQRAAQLRRLVREGRLEIVGGNYNEANNNLTCAESTIRNAVYGIGFQRDVLGGDPATAWMLDVFGHDPSYPSLMADAGLDCAAWARGPFHQWGPRSTVGDNTRMQFPSEFEWVSPDGRGLLTAYMPNHYGAGWWMAQRGTLEEAERAAYEQFQSLKPVAATRNVLLPVGADHVIPPRWCTGIHRDWNARYVWPRFVTAVPREFFAAVRGDARRRNVVITAQTRDMNPVYPGKDVSYIDTKQAHRAAETAVMDGERLATLAWLHGAAYPDAALDKAWRLLIFAGHHDAITGTESDQVYLDLLGGWREAYERGDAARRGAIAHLAALVDTTPPPGPAAAPGTRAVVVFNTLAADRAGLVTTTLRCPAPGTGWLAVSDGAGAPVPALAEGVARYPDGSLAEVTLTWRAQGVPGLGYRTYWVTPAAAPTAGEDAGWRDAGGAEIENDALRVVADPRRGGALSSVFDRRRSAELIPAGTVANELVVQEEYDYHPRWNEGPWLLMPKGPGAGSGGQAARVRAERCPIGRRLVCDLALGDLLITSETLLWDGADQVEFRTHVDGSIGHDRLLRVRFPVRAPGALPVYETAAAVIGRPFGEVDTDVGEHWYTLDNPAYTWFGLGSCARVLVRGADGAARAEAIGVAEVVMPDPPVTQDGCRGAIRDLVTALARRGVTATCTRAGGPRYGAIDLDSNLPDTRIAVGGPDLNGFTAEVLAAAGPGHAEELARRLADGGPARLWVPAAQTRAAASRPGADLRGPRDLPVLVLAGADLRAAVAALAADLAGPWVEAATAADAGRAGADADSSAGPGGTDLGGLSVALFNRGTPSSVVTPRGELHIGLMRSCSGWPSGVWIDEPKRTAPDGSSFSWQHWSHTFEYALRTGPGDWRDAGFTAAGQAYNHPLLAGVTGVHPGPLAAAASLLRVESLGPGSVVLAALKPHGNPAATGQPGRPGWRPATDPVTLRLRETSGRPARVAVRAAGRPLAGRVTNLIEERDGAALEADDDGAGVRASLPPAGTLTLLVVPGAGGPRTAVSAAPAPGAGLAPDSPPPSPHPVGRQRPAAEAAAGGAEPAQPVFTRYWLHGKGPAPAGYLPAAVHVWPTRVAVPAGPRPAAGLRVTLAAGSAPAAGSVTLDLPDGATADPAGPLRYVLAAGEFAAWDVTVRPPEQPGRHFVAARIADAAGQVFEDVATIAVGEEPVPPRETPLDLLLPLLDADQRATAAELDATMAAGGLTLAPGGRGEIAVRLANRARSQIRGEAQLISPFGSWAAITPWAQGFSAEPGEQALVRFEVAVPATARRGSQWWALVKIGYFGRLHYTAAVRLSVTG